MKHTPGPWTVHSEGHIRQLDPLGINIIPRNEADKNLIAAAPELLTALEAAQEALCEAGGREAVEALELIDAAIAKARGES